MSQPAPVVKRRLLILGLLVIGVLITLDFLRVSLLAAQERQARTHARVASVDSRLQQLSPEYGLLIRELDEHPQDEAVIEKVSSAVRKLMKRAKGYTTNLNAGELAFVQAYRLRQMRAYERYGKAYPQP